MTSVCHVGCYDDDRLVWTNESELRDIFEAQSGTVNVRNGLRWNGIKQLPEINDEGGRGGVRREILRCNRHRGYLEAISGI